MPNLTGVQVPTKTRYTGQKRGRACYYKAVREAQIQMVVVSVRLCSNSIHSGDGGGKCAFVLKFTFIVVVSVRLCVSTCSRS